MFASRTSITEPAPRRARLGGSHASALQPKRRTSSPPGSPRRKPCFCTTADTPNQLPAGLAPAEAMLPHYSRHAEPAPRRARPGGSHASALQPKRRTSSPPGSPRRKPCFCTTAETPNQLPAGLAPAEAMLSSRLSEVRPAQLTRPLALQPKPSRFHRTIPLPPIPLPRKPRNRARSHSASGLDGPGKFSHSLPSPRPADDYHLFIHARLLGVRKQPGLQPGHGRTGFSPSDANDSRVR